MNDTFLLLAGCAVIACGALVMCAVCLGALVERRASGGVNRRTHRLRFWLRIQGVLR